VITIPSFDVISRMDNILECREVIFNESGRPEYKDKFYLPIYLDMFGVYPPDHDWIIPGDKAPTMSGYYYKKDQNSDSYITSSNKTVNIILFDDFRSTGNFELYNTKDKIIFTKKSRLRTEAEMHLYVDSFIIGNRYNIPQAFELVGEVDDKYVLIDRRTYMQFTFNKNLCNII
jgi:hypothetical protein